MNQIKIAYMNMQIVSALIATVQWSESEVNKLMVHCLVTDLSVEITYFSCQ